MEKRNKCPAFHQIKISHAAYCRLKAKINYIYIHLNELQLQLCKLPQKDYEQFSYDFIETLCTRDFSRIESEGAEFARKILARFVKKKHFSLK